MTERLLRHTLMLSAADRSVLFWVGPRTEWVAPQSINVRSELVERYLEGLAQKDPLHITRLKDQERRIAALRHEQKLNPAVLDPGYEAYLDSIDVGDEIDLVFWHDQRPFACLALMRSSHREPFSLDGFDWESLRDLIQSTLKLHWRARAMLLEDYLVRNLALNPRELDVVRHLMIGKDNKQIAEMLGISVGTVKTHVVNILDKLGVDSRLAVACFVHELPARWT
jgi:DNA-binding CsgD family transcriptional regulator